MLYFVVPAALTGNARQKVSAAIRTHAAAKPPERIMCFNDMIFTHFVSFCFIPSTLYLAACASVNGICDFFARSAGAVATVVAAAVLLLVGVLGPESNAHGPDEFLHLPTVRRVTATVADVLQAHAARGS